MCPSFLQFSFSSKVKQRSTIQFNTIQVFELEKVLPPVNKIIIQEKTPDL